MLRTCGRCRRRSRSGTAEGALDSDQVVCRVETGRALVEAGLHPATGGDGLAACSGDTLLQALIACAGVTMHAVATALAIPFNGGRVRAEGDLDFRGTLAVGLQALLSAPAISVHPAAM